MSGRVRFVRVGGVALALALATLASFVPASIALGETDRPTWSDRERRTSGPEPMDAGDAASRHARAMADGPPPRASRSSRPARPQPAHGGWGARGGHVTRGGSGREGLGTAPPRLRRRLLGVDVDAAEAEAAGDPSRLLWPALGDIPPGLRCSGCELTLRAVHAEAVSAARRLRPPSWLAASPQTRETLAGANWNRACGALAADDATRVVGRKFTAGESYAEDVWARAEEEVSARAETTGTTGTTKTATGTDASSLGNATRGIISACALLRLDARAKLHLTGMVTRSGIHPFGAVEVREACVLVTGDATCRDGEGEAEDDRERGGEGRGGTRRRGRRRGEL